MPRSTVIAAKGHAEGACLPPLPSDGRHASYIVQRPQRAATNDTTRILVLSPAVTESNDLQPCRPCFFIVTARPSPLCGLLTILDHHYRSATLPRPTIFWTLAPPHRTALGLPEGSTELVSQVVSLSRRACGRCVDCVFCIRRLRPCAPLGLRVSQRLHLHYFSCEFCYKFPRSCVSNRGPPGWPTTTVSSHLPPLLRPEFILASQPQPFAL